MSALVASDVRSRRSSPEISEFSASSPRRLSWGALFVAFVCCLPFCASASVRLTSHSCVHSGSGDRHVVLHLADYKRGLFFGSCGPSSRSLRWEYTLDLKGPGPSYGKEAVEVKDGELRTVVVESGWITLDSKKGKVSIALRIKGESGPKEFVGNGSFKVQKVK